jgi:hypothetical protein
MIDNIKPMKIDRTGTVTITKDGIKVEGFETRNTSCREQAILAAAWAIGELQRELARTIKAPGGGKITIG